MKKIIKYILPGLLILSCLACNEDDKFKKELYRKLVYIVSDDDHLFELEYDLKDEAPEAVVSIACGGTNHADADIRVTLERDTVLLNKYNYSNFELNYSKYANELNPELFSMPSMSLILKSDSKDSYSTLPISIEQDVLESLSPDSTYFVCLAIKDISNYEVNPDKAGALCRVQRKNQYAETKTATYYTLKGFQTNPSGSVSSIGGSKVIHPLTQNKVRMFVGNKAFSATLDAIAKYAITVEVNADSTLTVTPYNKEAEWLEVEQLTPPADQPTFIYKNRYETAKKRFLLYYRYRVKNDDGSWDDWYTVQEADKRSVDEEEEE